MFTDTKSALLYVLFCAVIPYLLGSLSFSIIVSRLLFRKDVRNYGSHNAGMTNVLRTFGKGAAALTLAGRHWQGRGGRAAGQVVFQRTSERRHLLPRHHHRGVSGRPSLPSLAMCIRCISASRAARPFRWQRAPSLRWSPCCWCRWRPFSL